MATNMSAELWMTLFEDVAMAVRDTMSSKSRSALTHGVGQAGRRLFKTDWTAYTWHTRSNGLLHRSDNQMIKIFKQICDS